MRRKESQAPGSESMLYLMTHVSSVACPPRLNPSDPSSFPRSGLLMTVIQPRVSGWVLRKQTLRWRLACKKFIRNVLRFNAGRRKGKEIGLGRRRWVTIQSQQRTWLTPWGAMIGPSYPSTDQWLDVGLLGRGNDTIQFTFFSRGNFQ